MTATCQFCGQPTVGWQAPYHLNDNHVDNSAGNLAVSCPLCHLPQHLNRPEINSETVLIWLPEMAQGALNILARQVHLACKAAGLPPAWGQARSTSASPAAMTALAAYGALHERSQAAELRLGTCSPRQLGAALLDLPSEQYQRRGECLGGIRLLALGRLFAGGQDIYPAMLGDWAARPKPNP